MLNLSTNESEQQRSEAENIVALARSEYPYLSSGTVSTGLQFKWQLLQSGRNHVYRIDASSRWYLKLPAVGKKLELAGESLGYHHLANSSLSEQHFNPVASVRLNQDPPFILTAELPGDPANRRFYRDLFRHGRRTLANAHSPYTAIGHVLARLHATPLEDASHPTKQDIFRTFGNRLGRVKHADALTGEIAAWFASQAQDEGPRSFVHGNCALKNIIVDSSNRISLLDFETAGSGSPYVDIGMLARDFILCQSAPGLPVARAKQCLQAVLHSYDENAQLDLQLLRQYAALFVVGHYLQVHRVKKSRESIAGLPVWRSKLEQVVRRLISGGKFDWLELKRL